MEAEMACQSLSPHVQPYRRAVGKELTVKGSILAMLVCMGPGSTLGSGGIPGYAMQSLPSRSSPRSWEVLGPELSSPKIPKLKS